MLLLGLSGVYLTDSQDLSPPEGRSHVSHKPKEKVWVPSRLRAEAPGGPAHQRGPDTDQGHPQEPKTNLPTQDTHRIPTQTVVILQVSIPLYSHKDIDCFYYFFDLSTFRSAVYIKQF